MKTVLCPSKIGLRIVWSYACFSGINFTASDDDIFHFELV